MREMKLFHHTVKCFITLLRHSDISDSFRAIFVLMYLWNLILKSEALKNTELESV